MDISFPVFQFFGACDAQASSNNTYWNYYSSQFFPNRTPPPPFFFFLKIKTLCLKELPVKLVKTPPLLHPHMLLLCVTRSSSFHLPGVPGRDLISMSGLLCFCVEETQLLGPLSLELVCRKWGQSQEGSGSDAHVSSRTRKWGSSVAGVWREKSAGESEILESLTHKGFFTWLLVVINACQR